MNRRFFDNFFKEFEEMDRVFERLSSDITKNNVGIKNEPIYYGYSMHIGPDGVPHVEEYGTISPELEEKSHEEYREPFSDVIVDEKTKEVIVTLEMPGVEKNDIKLETTEDTIEVTAEKEERKYRKKIPLEVEIKPKSAKATYNNGVVEIKAKLKIGAKKGTQIKVE